MRKWNFKAILYFYFLSISFNALSQVPQTNNLISYYPFLGNLDDQSIKNHDTGIVNGNPTLTQNRFGTSNAAYYLDGTDDYLYFGNSIYSDLPDTDADEYYEDSFSISIWAKSSIVDNENFIAFGEANGLYTGMISTIGNTISFNSSNWGFPSTSTSGKKSDNNWHQYTFVYSPGSFRKLFIDGNLVKQANDGLRRFNFKNYGLSVGVGRFDALGTPEGLTTTYTGSVDDIRIWNVALTNTEVANLYTYENNAANDFSLPAATAPSAVTGSTSICSGDSTTLISSGGTTNSNSVDVWYNDACGGEAYYNGWDVLTNTTNSSTVNSVSNGILNVTSSSNDPWISMFSLGSFDPLLYKYINVRYKVISGTADESQIFFTNNTYLDASDDAYVTSALESDGNWHTQSIDMSTHINWSTGGNITG